MTEEVRVVAETPLLNTSTATRSNVIDQAKVESLPLSGRNPYALAYTLPGVTTQTTRESISTRPFDNGGMDAISINGGVTRSNEFLLDGAPNASREGGSAGQPGVRAVARRGPGSPGQHEHLRRAVRTDRRRRHRRQHPQRDQHPPRHQLLQPSRRRI